MTRSGRTKLGLALAAAVLAADQASKYVILRIIDLPSRGDIPLLPPVLDLSMVWNHGVTFGLLQARGGMGQLILGAVAVAVVAGLLLWLRRAETALVAAALGAVAGGALGNVVDRGRYGMVVDFLHLHWGEFDPFPFVFNAGDAAIVVGVTLLLLENLLPARAETPEVPARALRPKPPEA